MRTPETRPHTTQRGLVETAEMRQGKEKDHLNGLGKGLVKRRNLRSSQYKMAYACLLTRKGIAAKSDRGGNAASLPNRALRRLL